MEGEWRLMSMLLGGGFMEQDCTVHHTEGHKG
jgi:hypothetical protein